MEFKFLFVVIIDAVAIRAYSELVGLWTLIIFSSPSDSCLAVHSYPAIVLRAAKAILTAD
ncbi:MAG: hypothetical protein ABSD92_00500 [Candidatus Bathyarchaeia archaeon]